MPIANTKHGRKVIKPSRVKHHMKRHLKSFRKYLTKRNKLNKGR